MAGDIPTIEQVDVVRVVRPVERPTEVDSWLIALVEKSFQYFGAQVDFFDPRVTEDFGIRLAGSGEFANFFGGIADNCLPTPDELVQSIGKAMPASFDKSQTIKLREFFVKRCYEAEGPANFLYAVAPNKILRKEIEAVGDAVTKLAHSHTRWRDNNPRIKLASVQPDAAITNRNAFAAFKDMPDLYVTALPGEIQPVHLTRDVSARASS